MVKNYFFTLFFLFFGMQVGLFSQEPQIFRIENFDLKGNVKSCLVVTNYGKEEYEFDKEGRLTKSETRFSDSDYDITYYKFEEGELIEKRTENYRDGEFEPSTSFASFYSVDQADPRKVTEKIFSYDKKFLDSYEYEYDTEKKLIRIIHSGTEGEDETLVSYKGDEKISVQTFTMGGVVQKTITTSKMITDQGFQRRSILTVQFLDGQAYSALEQVFSGTSKLLSETKFDYNVDLKKFSPQEIKNYAYGDSGMLTMLTTKKGKIEEIQEFIYQYDSGDSGNWVKQIITPDNLYTTRKIKYYPQEKVAEKEE